jgi:hypothetical protein
MQGTLTVAFGQLANFPTPNEYWTLGEVLHDRYLHDGVFLDVRQFWRTAGHSVGSTAPGEFPKPMPAGRNLLRSFTDLWRAAGLWVALKRVARYVRDRIRGGIRR